jgi:hypothetical protein
MKSSTLTYRRLTAKTMRNALINEKGYSSDKLPSETSTGNLLNRLGYNLKKMLKAKPEKKLKKVTKSLKVSGK